MAFHISKLDSFGNGMHTDLDGYVPISSTQPWELRYDHGDNATHNPDGSLTAYGKWWENIRFPRIKDNAIRETMIAVVNLSEWRKTQK